MKSSILLLLLLTSWLHATLPNLSPGDSVTTNGTTFAACPEVSGTVLRDQLIEFEVRHPTLNHVILSGRLQDRVVRNSGGHIVFAPRLRDLDDPDGTAWVSEVRYTGFAGLTLGVEYRTDGAGNIGPRSISRSANGDTLHANHGVALIVPPDSQRTVIFSSKETEYALGGTVEILVNNDFGGQTFSTTIHGTASRHVPLAALPPAEEVREQLPRVILNKCIYQEEDEVTAEVHFTNLAQIDTKRLALIYGGPEGANPSTPDELEVVPLQATGDPLVYVTEHSLNFSPGAQPTQNDQKISLEPGDIFVAMLSYEYVGQQSGNFDLLATDWGTLIDENPNMAKVEVREGLTLTQDELTPDPNGKPMGTLFFEGDVGPVQVASKEILFFPKDENQLAEFLARTGGFISGFEGHPGGEITQQTKLPKPGTAWLTISMDGDATKIPALPQLRSLVGEQSTLSVSNQETLALIASAMELWSEGFLVGLNPRMQMHGPLYNPEHLTTDDVPQRIDSFGAIGDDGKNSLVLRNEVHGFRQSWALLKMFDYDERAIPVGVIDSGFAPNPDFKTSHPLYAERNLSKGTSGIGSAQTPQEVGNSFFGGKTWHGNGTVTTLTGVGGNRFGTAGIAAPTAVPKLYHMGLSNYALGFGSAIQIAVDDGCSVINISAGYPCRILSVLGNDDICTPGGRAAFALKLGVAVRAAAAAACAAGGVLDAIVPGLGSAVCVSAITAAEATAATLFSSVFLGSTRGPVERGVAYATERGVPIVASAGNRLSADALGALAPFVNFGNSNIDDWQVIPAVIPDVIAVGACYPWDENRWDESGGNFYANLHFWGDSVDLWAPVYTHYWAPEPGEADPATIPVEDHIAREFGATSCAAPIVSGIIANMMAIDPSLDRRSSAPATHPDIPGRIRDLLVNNAYQAGDPEAPDSADDRVLYEWNEDTEMFDEIDMPDSLLADLVNRRNYVNSWKTLRELARSRGLLEYESLGYHVDLGRNDRYADVAAPDGVILPVLDNTANLLDELGESDREFFYRTMPSTNRLFRTEFTATIPLSENRDNFRINGARGALVSTTTDEQTLSWTSAEYWRNTIVPTTIAGDDTLYKISTNVTSRPVPTADRFDFGAAENDSLDSAESVSDWQSVPATGLLEVEAWELCIDDLNIHHEEDRDFYRIDFPGFLGVPFSCEGLDPWITISLTPRTTAAALRVYSLNGGETRLLARGSGSRDIRIDCLDYLGRLPLYIEVESRAFIEYDLKIRWSKPDEGLRDRLNRIREAHAGLEEVPPIENFFPPEIPEFIGIFGLIPDSVVNPNPAVQQPLDQAGRYLFPRLMRLNILDGSAGNGVLALFPAGQSLRMELVGLNENVFAATGTPDHGFPDDPKAISGNTHYMALDFGKIPAGTYFLRISGHRPGDELSLYPSEQLLGGITGISMEDILGGGTGNTPAMLPELPGFGGEAFFTSLRPAKPPGQLTIAPAREVRFEADEKSVYQVELQRPDGVWTSYQYPIEGPDGGGPVDVLIDSEATYRDLRVLDLLKGVSIPFTEGTRTHHLRYQSIPGAPGILTTSPSLAPATWIPHAAATPFVGDGTQHEWFIPVPPATPLNFFRVEDE